MRVFHSVAEVPGDFGPSAVTIGNFDGVHAGHREIMRRLHAIARERALTPTVLTFDPHPARVLAPERAPHLLMTMEQRLRALEQERVETVLVIPFSLDFAKLSADEFAGQILAGVLHARCVLVGSDFRYGFRQAGNIRTLIAEGEKLGFEVRPVDEIERRSSRISSTAIRKLVVDGAVSRACRMLGSPFALEGDVVRGEGIGSRQTVPTLNLAARNEIIPKRGVYVTRTRDLNSSRRWPSITNIGVRPTFQGASETIETYLLEPLTGETPAKIEVQFLTFIREERRFETAEALRRQILFDARVAIRFHRRLSRLTVT